MERLVSLKQPLVDLVHPTNMQKGVVMNVVSVKAELTVVRVQNLVCLVLLVHIVLRVLEVVWIVLLVLITGIVRVVDVYNATKALTLVLLPPLV